MKRSKSLFVCILALLMIISSVSFASTAFADTVDGFYYQLLEDGTAEIRGVDKEATEITIPETLNGYTVTSINSYAFSNSVATSISLPDTLQNIDENALYNSSFINDESNWENGILYVGKYLIATSDNIDEDIVIKDGTRLIADYAFDGKLLKTLTIPASVEYIGDGAINCSIENGITVSADNKNYASVDGSLYSKDKTVLYKYCVIGETEAIVAALPDTVKEVTDDAFLYTGANFSELTLPASVEKLSSYVFSRGGVSVDTIIVHPDNKHFASLDGALYDKDFTEIIYYPWRWWNNEPVNYVAPKTLKTIADYAFSGVTYLKSVTLPEGLEYIGTYAFSGAYDLESINIPSTVTHIGEDAFLITKIYDTLEKESEDGIVYIDNCVVVWFHDGHDGELVIKDGTRLIADGAFMFSQYSSVSLPDSMEVIGKEAFYGSNISEVNLPEGITQIDNYAFKSTNLTSVTLPKSITKLGEGVFYACYDLKSATLPDTLTEIPAYMFDMCALSDEAILPDSVKIIGDHAFNGCDFDTIIIPKSVEKIGEYSFNFMEGIKGYRGTYAETYADENYLIFYPLEDEEKFELGDANCDSKLNVKDATAIQKHIAGIETLGSDGLSVADYNEDGKVNVKDATAIQKFIAGIL